jgi:hypothetical protein
MILLKFGAINSITDATELLQMAIGIEFSTLPPYLVSKLDPKSLPPCQLFNPPSTTKMH